MFITCKLDWRRENNVRRVFDVQEFVRTTVSHPCSESTSPDVSAPSFPFLFVLVPFFKNLIFSHLWCHKGSFATSQKSPSTSEAAGVAAGCKQRAKSAGAAVNLHRFLPGFLTHRLPAVPFSGQTQISRFPTHICPSLHLPNPSLPHLMVSDLIAFIGLAALQRGPDQLTGQKYPAMKWRRNRGDFFFFFLKESNKKLIFWCRQAN